VARTEPAGSERCTILPTEKASSGLARIETPFAAAASSVRLPAGAPSAITRAAIPAEMRASWAGSLSPTTATSSGVSRERATWRASITISTLPQISRFPSTQMRASRIRASVPRAMGPMESGASRLGVTYAFASPCSLTSPRNFPSLSMIGMFLISYSSIMAATSMVGMSAGAFWV